MHVATRLFSLRPNWALLPLLACLCSPLAAQVDYATPYTFSLLAGSPGLTGTTDGTGTGATFGETYGMCTDSKGNLYVADRSNHTIRMVTPAGVVTTIAGTAGTAGSTDGTGTAASFNQPSGVCIDSNGNLYVADTGNNVIRKITSKGVVTLYAGTLGSSGSTDGTGSAILFNQPYGVAIDSNNNLYIADFGNNTIRKVTSAGVSTTLAGTAGDSGTTDGTGANARFNQPTSVVIDSSGNLYVSDSSNNTVRKVTSGGVVTTIAGVGAVEGALDGIAGSSLLRSPRGVAVDSSGNVYVADSGNSLIRKISTSGVVTTLAGSPGGFSYNPGTGSQALFDVPIGIAVGTGGTLYVANELAYEISQGSAATAVAPYFTSQPTSVSVASGSTVVFQSAAYGLPAPTYQWYLNGALIPGATSTTLVLNGATAANAGTYTCLAVNSSSSVSSQPATLSVVSTTDIGRLTNISCRSQVLTGGNILIAGFVVGGAGTSGNENVLIRASGPALTTDFGLTGTLADPQLTLFSGATIVDNNEGWGGSRAIEAADAALGAFEWVNIASHDAALLETLPAGPYTAEVSSQTDNTGIALVEVYDNTPAGTYTLASPRIINLSARATVGTNGNILIAGFAIGGSTARTVLIRASGPALAGSPFNLTGTLPDPELALYSGSGTLLNTVTAWGGNPQVATAAANVGAFAWTSASSADSALLVTLPPGTYTVQVSGITGDTGIALIEIYEVP